ncbi:MAG: ISNCY family transposase [Planctomycetales bacterium]|nr:ISNCY family transposase [Planctomycetales bacterium]
MRQAYSDQLRLDTVPISKVELNLQCRDRIVPVLRALQHVYCNSELRAKIVQLIGSDINRESRTDTGRQGMDYWHICVLIAVRLGCDYTYDELQDLAENHCRLRAIMGLGSLDETQFHHKTLRNTFCLLRPETLEQINRAIVEAGHQIRPDAIEKVRADSFVMETNIHYPTESSLLVDGLGKIICMCVLLADEHGIHGWRQHSHLLNKVKKLHRNIHRVASKKGPNYKSRLKPLYRELLQKTALLTQRARELCQLTGEPAPALVDLFGPNTLQAFIVRTERVADTARRRVINGESVPNGDKLFSVFEPHTQLYKRGKAGQPIQFGRQVLVFEDAAGFIVRGVLMNRDENDKDVAVRETKSLQETFHNKVQRLSFDRGFHSPKNQTELSKLVTTLCLPKPGAKQSVVQQSQADEEFLAAQQNHSGVESTIGALQSGNAMKRCRDRSELGCERYMQLAHLGRNLQTLGRLLIKQDNEDAPAGHSRRKAA